MTLDVSSCRTQSCTSRPRYISDVSPTHTEPTHVCSRIERNHHYRHCLYNIEIRSAWRCDTEWNTIRTPWVVSPSLAHLPKKRKQCLLPEPKTADPLVPEASRNRRGKDPHHHKPREITVEDAHNALLGSIFFLVQCLNPDLVQVLKGHEDEERHWRKVCVRFPVEYKFDLV